MTTSTFAVDRRDATFQVFDLELTATTQHRAPSPMRLGTATLREDADPSKGTGAVPQKAEKLIIPRLTENDSGVIFTTLQITR